MVSSSLSTRIRYSTEAQYRNRAGGGLSGIGSPDQWPGCQLSTVTPTDPSSNEPRLATSVVGTPYLRADHARSVGAQLPAPLRHSTWTRRPRFSLPRTRRVSRATPLGTTSLFNRCPGNLILNSLVGSTGSSGADLRRDSVLAMIHRAAAPCANSRIAANGLDLRREPQVHVDALRRTGHNRLDEAKITAPRMIATTWGTSSSRKLMRNLE